MKKYKYEFEVPDDFQKGYCHDCPLTYLSYDEDYGYEALCCVYARYDNCPLQEVES